MHAPPFEPVDAALTELADAHGVATQYWDQAGRHVQVSATTVRAVLAALGVAAATDAQIADALDEVRMRDWRRMLPPVFISVQGEQRRAWVHVPHGTQVSVHVELEDGTERALDQMQWWVDPVEVDGVLTGEASFAVPGDLPIGWHTLTASTPDHTERIPLVMTPRRLDPDAVTRQWGFMTQVYATRSSASWGLGDIADAAWLGEWSATNLGAGFLLINPVHAGEPTPPVTPSPYLPTTRRFVSPLYLRVEDIAEFAGLKKKRRARIAKDAAALQARNASADHLDRDAVWAAKLRALRRIFAVPRTRERERAFAAFCSEQGAGLVDFATWCALFDALGAPPWPKKYRHPGNPAVAKFRKKHRAEITFYLWLQWITDEQLADAQERLREAGMPIGLIHDLAVGVHPEGADAWALQDVLAPGVSVGAPPDMYNQMGQNWSQPPWRPDALADRAFVPYRDMLRTVLRSAGGLRIDHVLGLFRMWWIPDGMPANAGTFVRFDFDAMIGILVLEAQRAGAIVIGEDLGTVEPWVQQVLADRGILGTSILWFEAWESGFIKAPSDWRSEVLASVTVHDLPPTAGYLRDEHVRIRNELGLLEHPLAREQASSAQLREAWAQLLRQQGWLDWAVDLSTDAGIEAFTIALYRALADSPARLLGVALPDVFGDQRAQNQPGTDQEYPNWRVAMTDGNGAPVVLEDLDDDPELLRPIIDAVRAGRTLAP